MKKLIATLGLTVVMFTAFAQIDSAEITFETTTHDFGTVKKGGPTTYKFWFQNTGKSALILTRCQQSCGCTTPHCPVEAIPAGGRSFVEVHYDSLRVGPPFTKTVTVYSNAKNNNVILTIKGNIVEDAEKKD